MTTTPKDLSITPEERAKLDAIAEAELAKAPSPLPSPSPQSGFFQRVRVEMEKQGLESVDAPGMMKIADIVIGDGRRDVKENAVLEMMESIRELGLLQPIVVTPAKRLVDGAHRVEACTRLGYAEIQVVIRPFDALQGEMAMIDANLVRNDLNAMERAEALTRRKVLYESLHPTAKQGKAPGKSGGGKRPIPKDERVASFAADTASKTGLSPRTIQADAQIVKGLPKEVRDRIRRSEIATNRSELLRLSRIRDTEQQRRVAVEIADGRADSVAKAIDNIKRKARDEVARRLDADAPEMPEGPWDVIVADPAWRFQKRAGDSTHRNRAGVEYPDMTVDAIKDLPVGDLAAEDCVLWLWAPNAFIVDGTATEVIEAWGFTPKTMVTWAKPGLGTGDWLRGATEHAILAVRGRPTVTLTNQSTLLPAPVRDHSRKPVEFWALVDSLCHGKKLELFSREPRKGWSSWGAETGKFVGVETPTNRADDIPSATTPGADSPTARTTP
jgi:N6-adenosine-specific RNA methylase IME4